VTQALAQSPNGHLRAPAAVSTRTVAICGTAGSSRREIMELSEGVEAWGLNLSYQWMPHWTRWFEMHDPDVHGWIFKPEHRAWLREARVPIYMQRRDPEFPTSVEFPVEAVTEGGRFRPYFTSSIAYMLALAIHEGFEEIRLLGANMASDSEYAYQRAACEYWIGIAEAKGIRVYLPASCPLTVGPRYGADRPNADMLRAVVDKREGIKTQIEQVNGKLALELRALLERHRMAVSVRAGALELGELGAERRAALEAEVREAGALLESEIRELVEQHETTITACAGALQLADQLMAGEGSLQTLREASGGRP